MYSMIKDLVTIIITTYGENTNVVDAVESCISQTYSNIEIIVVDDNGRGTARQEHVHELLHEYIEDGKIQYITNEINSNASFSRNAGFEHSHGEFIALLDDDDVFFDKKIEQQVKCFKELDDRYGVVYCSMEDVDPSGRSIIYSAHEDGDVLYSFLMMKVCACTSNIMVRREAFKAVNGFDQSFRRHQDWEFLARVANRYYFRGISYVGTRKNTKNVVKRFTAAEAEKYRLKYLECVKKEFSRLPIREQRRVLGHEYNEIAKLYCREHNVKKTIEYIKKSKMVCSFAISILLKPFSVAKRKVYQKCGRQVVLIR